MSPIWGGKHGLRYAPPEGGRKKTPNSSMPESVQQNGVSQVGSDVAVVAAVLQGYQRSHIGPGGLDQMAGLAATTKKLDVGTSPGSPLFR